jgi:phenylacetate-CoA ligase
MLVHQRVRYNPRYYNEATELLREIDVMGREDRRALSLRLTGRALTWARQTKAGASCGSTLTEWPLIDRNSVRGDYFRYVRPECSWISTVPAGEVAAPMAVHRSQRSIAADQAYLDDLLGVWDLTFASSRIARLRGDEVRSNADNRPPYGAYRNWRRTLMLSSRHLNSTTAAWFHQTLREFEPEMLYTEPAAGAELSRLLVELDLKLQIPLILSSADGLVPDLRRQLENTFEATVLDYYRQPENAAFAAGIAVGAYYFNPVYSRIEFLRSPGVEAPEAFHALEIVGTGFWNEAMPLVRYRTGDVAIVPAHYTADDLEDVALGMMPVAAILCRPN